MSANIFVDAEGRKIPVAIYTSQGLRIISEQTLLDAICPGWREMEPERLCGLVGDWAHRNGCGRYPAYAENATLGGAMAKAEEAPSRAIVMECRA